MPTLKYHLLLVEDDPDTLTLMERLLSHEGYSVTCADSVEAALTRAEERHFDLLVSDLLLSDGRGTELIEPVARKQNIPAIALSGIPLDGETAIDPAEGFDVFLLKPISFMGLAQAIGRVLDAGAASRVYLPAPPHA